MKYHIILITLELFIVVLIVSKGFRSALYTAARISGKVIRIRKFTRDNKMIVIVQARDKYDIVSSGNDSVKLDNNHSDSW